MGHLKLKVASCMITHSFQRFVQSFYISKPAFMSLPGVTNDIKIKIKAIKVSESNY